MSSLDLYTLGGVVIVLLALYAATTRGHLVWKVLALNLLGSGVFLILVSAPARRVPSEADPIPQAMVLTGIVVTAAATALALGIALRVAARTGRPFLDDDPPDQGPP